MTPPSSHLYETPSVRCSQCQDATQASGDSPPPPISHTLSVPQDDVVCYSQVKASVRDNRYVALKVAKDR